MSWPWIARMRSAERKVAKRRKQRDNANMQSRVGSSSRVADKTTLQQHSSLSTILMCLFLPFLMADEAVADAGILTRVLSAGSIEFSFVL